MPTPNENRVRPDIPRSWSWSHPGVPLGQRPFAFLDAETTGLNTAVHEVIELAIIIDEPGPPAGKNRLRWSTKIKPERIGDAEPTALKINGYTPEAWEDAPYFKDVAPKIIEILDQTVLVGHNIPYDVYMLKFGLIRLGYEWDDIPYHMIDTVALAHEHLVPHGLPGLGLDKVLRHLGLSRSSDIHGAMEDTELAREVFYRLFRALPGSFDPYPDEVSP